MKPPREGLFDHAVLNLHYGVDEGEALLASLGFTVSPRGYHTLGSIHHTVALGSSYLEIVGLDPANPKPRKELLDSPLGLDGLVWSSDDIQAAHARLVAAGLPASEPGTFGRPVSVDGHEVEARFEVTRLAPGWFAPARLYFCDHLTPELVWQEGFSNHPNTADRILAVHVAAEDPAAEAARLATFLGVPAPGDGRIESGGVPILFETPETVAERLGEPFSPEARVPRVAGLTLGVRSLDALETSLAPRWAGAALRREADAVTVPAAACFGVTLAFREGAGG